MKLSLRTVAYVAVILAALSVVLHEMGGTAGAQIAGSPVVAVTGDWNINSVYTADGNVYVVDVGDAAGTPFRVRLAGNLYAGPTATSPKTWSGIKGGTGH